MFFKEVIAAGEAWIRNCPGSVVKLSRANELGEAMFGMKLIGIVSAAVRAAIDAEIDRLFTPGAGMKSVQFNNDVLVEMRTQILEVVALVEGAESLPSKRNIDIRYRSSAIQKVPVLHLAMEVEYRILAMARGAAVWQGFLVELPAEKIMNFRSTAVDKRVDVDQEMTEMRKAICLPSPFSFCFEL